ncbi:hypothetical protein ACLMJV_16880 [Sinorhizobium meliloti]|uniref:hypothetical protein n=1 Tax=Rhizobium meliloti TaxID=382 RepID=UPI00398CF2C1
MNKEDRKDLVERLRNISRGDHERLCQGREYVCSCDYDETSWKTAEEAAAEIDRLRRELKQARKALGEAEETLRLVEHPAFPDPLYHEQVKALGRQIGFGALMSTASAAWREVMAERGYPVGSEFVAGPCHGTVVATLGKIRAALRAEEEGK